MQLEVKELIALIEYIKDDKDNDDDSVLDGLYYALDEIRYDLRAIKEKMKIRQDLNP